MIGLVRLRLFTKPWSAAVNDLYFQFFIVRVLIDLICHLPRIGYEEAGNQSLERRGFLSLFLSAPLSVSVCVPQLCLVQTERRRGVGTEKEEWRLPAALRGVCFLAPQGENTIGEPVYCPWLPQWWFFLPWTLLNGYSHVSGPHNDSYRFTSNSMFKDRKKTLPLALPRQHFVVVRAIQGLSFSFTLLRFQVFG